MPKRMNSALHRELMQLVIQRDGDRCLLCGKTQFKPRERTIDHMDNNPRNNRLENLHLLCRGCNTGESNRRRAGKLRLLTTETLHKFLSRLPQTDVPTSQVPIYISPYSAHQVPGNRPGKRRDSTLEVSGLLMPVYWWWVFQWVKEKGSISRDEAITGGAGHLYNVVGRGHPKTVEPYFAMITGVTGFLGEDVDSNGVRVWVFRPGWDLETLEEKLKRDAGAA